MRCSICGRETRTLTQTYLGGPSYCDREECKREAQKILEKHKKEMEELMSRPFELRPVKTVHDLNLMLYPIMGEAFKVASAMGFKLGLFDKPEVVLLQLTEEILKFIPKEYFEVEPGPLSNYFHLKKTIPVDVVKQAFLDSKMISIVEKEEDSSHGEA
ncbi:MAG: hypothetical protein ACTSXF_15120 [Promethearchaeota archaeon]